MITADADFITAVGQNGRHFAAKIYNNGSEVTCDIISITSKKGAQDGQSFTAGAVFSSSLEITCSNLSVALENEDIELQIGILTDRANDTYKYITYGKYTVIRAQKNQYQTVLKCVGFISSKFNEALPDMTTPTLSAVATAIGTATGVTVSFVGVSSGTTNTLAEDLTGITCRSALSIIAFAVGGYATENSTGGVEIHQFAIPQSTYALSAENCLAPPVVAEDSFDMTGIKVIAQSSVYILTSDATVVVGKTYYTRSGTGTSDDPYIYTEVETPSGNPASQGWYEIGEISYTSGSPIRQTYENKYVSQSVFNTLAAVLVGYEFDPAEIDMSLGDPRLEPWDCLTVTDVDGTTTHTVPCHVIESYFDGGFSSKIYAIGESESDTEVTGSLSESVKRVITLSEQTSEASARAYAIAQIAKTSADGKNKIFYSASTPTGGTYNIGDTWFNSSEDNAIYTWSGSAWVKEELGEDAIANLSITNAKIADATIQSAKIGNVDVAKLTGGYIDASHINASSITIGQSQVTNLVSDLSSKKSIHTLTSKNTTGSTYASILTWTAEGYSTSWGINTTATPLTNVKIGDTCRVAYKVTDMNGATVYCVGTVTSISGDTIYMTMHGLDTTVIDGGNILANSITSSQMATNSITIGNMDSSTISQVSNANIEIGGRNLLRSGALTQSSGASFVNNGTSYSLNFNQAYSALIIPASITAETGDITISYRFKKTDGTLVNIAVPWSATSSATYKSVYYDGVSKTLSNYNFSVADDTNEHTVSYTLSLSQAANVYIQLNRAVTTAVTAEIWDIKVEKGNKATDWTPAPEDTDNAIATVDAKQVTYRGTMTSGGGTYAKVATCTGFKLATGAVISLYMSSSEINAAALTLNINNTGAKSIYVGGSAVSATNRLNWLYGCTVTFVYDGTNYVVADTPPSYMGGNCTTGAGTSKKETVVDQAVIFKGATITVPMADINTATSPTLFIKNSSNTGISESNIYHGYSTTTPTWTMGSSVTFTFDGQYWRTDISDRFARLTQTGTSATATAYPWFKIASVNINALNTQASISFDVTHLYTGSYDPKGKLNVFIRKGSDGSVNTSLTKITWVDATETIKSRLSDFVIAYKPSDVASDVEVWVRVPDTYWTLIFKPLTETYSTYPTHNKWNLYINSSSDAKSAVTTGYSTIASKIDTASQYVTRIDDNGIYISPASQSPSSGSEGNSVRVDGTGMEVYKGSVSVAKYGDTARIGKTSGGNVVVDSSSVSLKDGANTVATFKRENISGTNYPSIILASDYSDGSISYNPTDKQLYIYSGKPPKISWWAKDTNNGYWAGDWDMYHTVPSTIVITGYRTAGWLSSSSTGLYFTIPLSRDVLHYNDESLPNNISASNVGIITRQNNAYTHGSSSSTRVSWTLDYAIVREYGIAVGFTRSTTTNAVNNSPIGIDLSCTLTIAHYDPYGD